MSRQISLPSKGVGLLNIRFYGAAKEVTGSCHCIEANGKKILIDCGMQQGSDEKDNQQFQFDPKEIDCVVLTHAHIDHSGRLPLLVKEGFKGKIFATKATCNLLSIMLRDSAHIQEMDAIWENRKGRRAGKAEAVPLYAMKDAEKTLEQLVECNYKEQVIVTEGIKVTFVDAGHILGSSSAVLTVTEGEHTEKIVFSGDIGNINQPIIRDPQPIKEADYVVMESTYGDKNHEECIDCVSRLADVIDNTLRRGGNVVIPSFAVGRTQELLYFIREIKEQNLVKSVPNFPVCVDSPLAIEATKIYEEELLGYADEETLAVLKKGNGPLRFPGLRLINEAEESKSLNFDETPKVIISSSGMCEAGRIRHHLKHNLWRPESSVIFVGFQAVGTLGRMLLDGVKRVKLFGEEVAVKAQIHNFRGLSAHADRKGLLHWVNYFDPRPKKVFLIHGEDSVTEEFTETLSAIGFEAIAPELNAVYDLKDGSLLQKGSAPEKKVQKPSKPAAYSYAVADLQEALMELEHVVEKSKKGANKDMLRFADEILSLAKKWY